MTPEQMRAIPSYADGQPATTGPRATFVAVGYGPQVLIINTGLWPINYCLAPGSVPASASDSVVLPGEMAVLVKATLDPVVISLFSSYGESTVRLLSGAPYVYNASGNIIGLVGLSLGNFSYGPDRPLSNPTLSDSGVAGNPNGQYWGKVTFVTADGETDAVTSIPASVTVASKRINWSAIPVSSSPLVTARRLYRTVAGADSVSDPREFYLLATINDNTTTTYTDNTADGSLGAQIPSVNTAVPYISRAGARWGNFIGNSYALGSDALATGTGYASIAIGQEALKVNTRGKRNVAIGTFALAANTTGNRNTAIGVHALNNVTTSSDNTAVGYGALITQASTATFPNTAVGSQALYSLNNATGGNTAVGTSAGYSSTSGTENTFVGYYAGQASATGNSNTFIGHLSGYQSNGGGSNVGVGTKSFNSLVGGNNNTAIGLQAGAALTSQNSTISIGWYANKYGTTSSELFIDALDRTSYAGQQTGSLIYGVFNATPTSQTLTINGRLTVGGDGTLIRTNVALTNGAAAATATMTNGPTAGNPTKWIPIIDNGTTRYIPTW